jgi:hypothetical protein
MKLFELGYVLRQVGFGRGMRTHKVLPIARLLTGPAAEKKAKSLPATWSSDSKIKPIGNGPTVYNQLHFH